MNQYEMKVRRIAHTDYNVHPDSEIPQRIRQKIERRYNLEPPVEIPEGEHYRDRWYREKRENQAAERAIQQREALAKPTIHPSGKEQRVKLLEAKARNVTSADPGRKARMQQELEEARSELAQEKQEQVLEQKETASKQALSENERYQLALQNAEVTERLTRNDPSEHVHSLIRLKIVQNATLDTVDDVVKDYWQGESAYKEREALAEQRKLEPLTEQAAEAVSQAAEQQNRVTTAQHGANLARLDSEQD